MISKQDIINATGSYSLTIPDARHDAWVNQAIELELVGLTGDEFVTAYKAYDPNSTDKPEFAAAYELANLFMAFQIMVYVNAEWGINVSQSGVVVPNDPSGTFTAATSQQRSNLTTRYAQMANAYANKLNKYLHDKKWTLDDVVFIKIQKTNNINRIITAPLSYSRGINHKSRYE